MIRFILISSLVLVAGCSSQITGFRLAVRGESVKAVAFLTGTDQVACGFETGVVEVWDIKSREKLKEMKSGGDIVNIAVTAGSSSLLFSSTDKKIGEWLLQDRSLIWSMSVGQDPFIALSHSKRFFALGDFDIGGAVVRVFDLQDRKELTRWAVHDAQSTLFSAAGIGGVCWSSDDNCVGVLITHLRPNLESNKVVLIDAKTAKVANSFTIGQSTSSAVAMSISGRIAAASFDGVRIWEKESSQPIKHLQPGEEMLQVAFSPDGRYLAAGGSSNKVRIWETGNWTEVGTASHGGHFLRIDAIFCLAFSADSRRLVSGSSDGTVYVWNIAEKS